MGAGTGRNPFERRRGTAHDFAEVMVFLIGFLLATTVCGILMIAAAWRSSDYHPAVGPQTGPALSGYRALASEEATSPDQVAQRKQIYRQFGPPPSVF